MKNIAEFYCWKHDDYDGADEEESVENSNDEDDDDQEDDCNNIFEND